MGIFAILGSIMFVTVTTDETPPESVTTQITPIKVAEKEATYSEFTNDTYKK